MANSRFTSGGRARADLEERSVGSRSIKSSENMLKSWVRVSVKQYTSYIFILFLKNKFIYLFIYLWLRWVFVAARGLLIAAASLVVEHGLQARGLGSVVVARGL